MLPNEGVVCQQDVSGFMHRMCCARANRWDIISLLTGWSGHRLSIYETPMEPQENNKKGLVVGIIAIIVIVGGYLLFASPANGPEGAAPAGESKIVRETPKVTEEQLLGDAGLSQSQQSDILKHKQDILRLARSGKALSDEEKSTIGNIMLTRAHLYNFTDAEREAVFDSLRR